MAKKKDENVPNTATQADLGRANSESKSGEIDNAPLDANTQDTASLSEKAPESTNSASEAASENKTEPHAKTKTATSLDVKQNVPPPDLNDETNIIHPVAVDISLREIYPHESYGRCGLRFKKGQTQRIAFAALEPEALLELENDPWLALAYVCE